MDNNEQQFVFDRSKKNESMMNIELMKLENPVFSNNSMIDNKEIEIMYDS